MKRRFTLLLIGWLLGAESTHSEPVLRTVGGATAGVSLLRDGDFEQLEEGRPVGWQAAPKGFQLAAGEGRHGSRALRCDNPSAEGWFGASQTLTLERTNPAPLIVRGWSKAANVTGGTDRDYSLYADLVYADGTTLWGQTANFRTGTHDWQERRLMIFPDKPVRTLTLHCLFRNHAGHVWFDDVSVEEAAGGANAVLFQGAAVTAVKVRRPAPRRERHTVTSGDGLRLELDSAVAVSSRQARASPVGIFHEADRALASIRNAKGPPEGGTTNGRRDRSGPSLVVADAIVRKQPGPLSARFLARDVAAGSDFFDFSAGRCAELGLDLRARAGARSNHIVIEGRLTDTTGKDRAITLVFAVPLDATGWTWGDDLHRHRTINGRGEFANQVSIHAGATGSESLYPVAPVWNARTGLALGLDMGRPAVYRLGYQADLKVLFIAYDFGLVKDTARFPSGADFRFVVYRFDPRGGFRAAWQKFMELFPGDFVVRSKEQGLWMPFTDVSRVRGWQDFGFRYHEGNNNVAWDDAHGVLSFRYTEPMTWWMPMAKDVPRTVPEALRVRDELERGTDPHRRRMAEVTRVAAMYDETGEPEMLFRDTPWSNGAVWSLNPNPWLGQKPGARESIPGAGGSRVEPRALPLTRPSATLSPTGGEGRSSRRESALTPPEGGVSGLASAATGLTGRAGGGVAMASGKKAASAKSRGSTPLNAATVYWNHAIKEELYGPQAKGHLDGEYLDSLEGYVTAELNFRREHFAATTVPLTFDTESNRPALFKGLAVFEFTRWLAQDVHRMGKLMFANGVPYRFAYLCPWLDVLGTETDWLAAGRYRPASVATMDLWRSLAGAKPYLLLMNTDYDQFGPELVEKYFQRALFYGMWPGFFSHNASENPYWGNPKWYDRDRPLFRRYLPLIRAVAEAGWQPVTHASCDNENIFVERFGPDPADAVYLTLFNDSATTQQGRVVIDSRALGLPRGIRPEPLLGREPGRDAGDWRVSLESQRAAVWRLTR